MDRDRQLVFLGRPIDRPIVPPPQQALTLRQHQDRHEPVVAGAAFDLFDGEIRRLHRHHDRSPQAGIARQPFGGDPVVDRLAEGGSHIGIVHGLRAVEHVADRVTGTELVERPALNHREIAAGLAVGRAPVGPTGQWHVGRIAREIEAIDRPAHHLFLPVIVEIRQQRGARSAHGGMDIAVDPRGGHARSLNIVFGDCLMPRFKCAADRPGAQGITGGRTHSGLTCVGPVPLQNRLTHNRIPPPPKTRWLPSASEIITRIQRDYFPSLWRDGFLRSRLPTVF